MKTNLTPAEVEEALALLESGQDRPGTGTDAEVLDLSYLEDMEESVRGDW